MFSFQIIQFTVGSIVPFMTIFSIITQTPLYETFGEKGCLVLWLSSMIASHSLVIGMYRRRKVGM